VCSFEVPCGDDGNACTRYIDKNEIYSIRIGCSVNGAQLPKCCFHGTDSVRRNGLMPSDRASKDGVSDFVPGRSFSAIGDARSHDCQIATACLICPLE
jgi:hypothetical protein